MQPKRFIDENMEAAAEEQDYHRKQVEEIRSDRDLTPEGKQRRMAGLQIEHEKQLFKLRQKRQQALASRQSDLTREIASPSLPQGAGERAAVQTAYRDALDRADRLESQDDAVKALERARNASDDLWERAIAVRAAQQGWSDVLETFTSRYPHVGKKVRELAEVREALNDPTARLQVDQVFSANRPPELSRTPNALDLKRLAGQTG